jgi:hypothetical protein
VSPVRASTVDTAPASTEAASSMVLPSSPELGPIVFTFGAAFPKDGFDASSLPHPQGPTAAHARTATVTQ